MQRVFRALTVLAALLCCVTLGAARAETAEAPTQEAQGIVVALVNGEALTQTAYERKVRAYVQQSAEQGLDVSDETVLAYVQDLALTAAIEEMLVEQDMRAQGCYDIDEQTAAWCQEQGEAAYAKALADVADMLGEMLEPDADTVEYALLYAKLLGVTEQDYVQVYRTQFAAMRYYDWLTRDVPVTQAEVEAAFAAQDDEPELTQAVYDALAAALYTERWQERLKMRVDVLAESAEVVLY